MSFSDYWGVYIVAVVLLFAFLESYALATGRTTLSRATWDLTKAWPPLPWLVGLVMGFVSAHFWWGGSLICY